VVFKERLEIVYDDRSNVNGYSVLHFSNLHESLTTGLSFQHQLFICQ
jgi:hypothetical protein